MSSANTRTLFSGLSAELAAMMETVEGLSSLIADHVRQTPADRRSGVLVRAQAVDELHQTLASLRELTGALSTGVPVETALADIPLSALADRLRGAALAHDPAAAARAGDLVLFD